MPGRCFHPLDRARQPRCISSVGRRCAIQTVSTIAGHVHRYGEDILGERFSSGRGEIALHDGVVEGHQTREAEQTVLDARRVLHDASDVSEQNGVERGRSTIEGLRYPHLSPYRKRSAPSLPAAAPLYSLSLITR